MTNEFKKQCGQGMYWCNTDKMCKPIEQKLKEDGEGGMVGGSPVNNVGDGNIAGLGVGRQGEPGVTKKNKKSVIPFKMFKRIKPAQM